jgi:hypothetical protein
MYGSRRLFASYLADVLSLPLTGWYRSKAGSGEQCRIVSDHAARADGAADALT